MSNIDNTNLIEFVRNYLSSIGIVADTLSDYFEATHFDRALILNLSPVCLMPKNKPATSSSNQTHIHVTGLPRYFFFTKDEVDSNASSSNDKKLIVDVSLANLKALNKKSTEISLDDLEIKQSFTLSKIAHRQNQENQVQISKIKLDDSLFINLRLGLYTNDLLIFLGYRNSTRLLAIGIPKEYYLPIASIGTSVFFNLNDKVNIKIKTALKKIETSYDNNEVIADIEVIDDSIYQQQLVEAEPTETTHAPMPKAGKSSSTNEHPKRNAARGKEAVKDCHYLCGLDCSHLTFLSRTGLPYIEAHHLIPMAKEDDFENSLDVKANILPLCPNCHAKIHFGTPEEVFHMIELLYEERKELLALSGIGIDLETLKQYYS